MANHLLVISIGSNPDSDDSVGGGSALLRSEAGEIIRLPVAWLPAGVREGAAVLVEVQADSDAASWDIRLVQGTSEPDTTDIGA